MAIGEISPPRAVGMRPTLSTRWYAVVPLGLVSAAVWVPVFLHTRLITVSFVFYRGFALVCHQRPDRSFWLFGAPVAVCARCLGIYLGAAFGLLLRTSRRIALRLLIAAAALNILDWLVEASGLHGNWIRFRFLLGIALGAAGALVISSSISPDPQPNAEICSTDASRG